MPTLCCLVMGCIICRFSVIDVWKGCISTVSYCCSHCKCRHVQFKILVKVRHHIMCLNELFLSNVLLTNCMSAYSAAFSPTREINGIDYMIQRHQNRLCRPFVLASAVISCGNIAHRSHFPCCTKHQ